MALKEGPMRLVRLIPLTVLFAIPAAACAVKIPPATSFAPADWQRVMSLPPDTHIQVTYVSSVEGAPRKYGFRGSLTSVTASFIEMTSEQGPQRLMAERVLSVSLLRRKRESGVTGALIGALVAGAIGAPILKAINERDYWTREAFEAATPIMAVGAVIGVIVDWRVPAYHGVEIYRRR
jgi:hypothetical protein